MRICALRRKGERDDATGEGNELDSSPHLDAAQSHLLRAVIPRVMHAMEARLMKQQLRGLSVSGHRRLAAAILGPRGDWPGRGMWKVLICEVFNGLFYLTCRGDPCTGGVMHNDLGAPVPQLKLGRVGADDVQGAVLLVPEGSEEGVGDDGLASPADRPRLPLLITSRDKNAHSSLLSS